MAFDGVFLSAVKKEIMDIAADARVDKIYQPSKEEVIFVLRTRKKSEKLLINVSAGCARIHFTELQIENPKNPPMFCMLLRKHLGAGRLISVRQVGTDRILMLDFQTVNELGDMETLTVAVEIMGRHSNLILINSKGRIIDSIKRVDDSMSSVRRVLPGAKYELPPMQDKLPFDDTPAEEIVRRIRESSFGELSKIIMNSVQGFSPILSREAVQYAAKTTDLRIEDAGEEVFARLEFFFGRLKKNISSGECVFTAVYEDSKKPKDFTLVPVTQYGSFMLTKNFESPGELLDSFYFERDRVERMKQRGHELLKKLINLSERTSRKLEAQKQELAESRERDTFKIYGDIISANLYTLKKGMTSAKLVNFYDENGSEVEIKLDPALTPQENAQKYYREYRKAAAAEKHLKRLIEEAEKELLYIDSVFDAVSRTTGERELDEIREELIEQGYIRRNKGKKTQLKPMEPIKYRSSDGFLILAGRNNKQNDKLTLKQARPTDIWCHTHDIPGAHVIIVTEGKQPPEKTILQACIIAAYNSKGRESSQVPVDYTFAKYVKKPSGAKPGMVIFENNKTLFVKPDEDIVLPLLID